MVSKRQREYLREIGYKVNREDDNGDGATKQDALPLTPPFLGVYAGNKGKIYGRCCKNNCIGDEDIFRTER